MESDRDVHFLKLMSIHHVQNARMLRQTTPKQMQLFKLAAKAMVDDLWDIRPDEYVLLGPDAAFIRRLKEGRVSALQLSRHASTASHLA